MRLLRMSKQAIRCYGGKQDSDFPNDAGGDNRRCDI